MPHKPDSESEHKAIKSHPEHTVSQAPDMADHSSNKTWKVADKAHSKNHNLPETHLSDTNKNGDTLTVNGKGQITEFHYNGQNGSFKILEQKPGGEVTKFTNPDGTTYTKTGDHWGGSHPTKGVIRGGLDADIRVDKTGLHLDNEFGKEYFDLPLQSVPHETNKAGDIFTRDRDGRVDEFQYKGAPGSYKIQGHYTNGDVSRISTPSGDRFEDKGSDAQPYQWYRYHWSNPNDPYERATVTGPIKGVKVHLTENGLNPEARKMLDRH